MRFIFLAIFASILASCAAPANEFQTELVRIDSLRQEVEAAQQRYLDQVNAKETLRILNVIKEDMSKMTMKFKNEMTEEQAVIFSEYNSAKRLIKDFPKQHKNIAREFDRTLNQLTLFRNALDSSATIDALGNEIDAAYVGKQYAIEARVADGLIKQIDLNIGYTKEANSEFERLKEQVEELLTSPVTN
ncbi:MAG: hypothetical protein ACJAU0_000524 [Flavobacteriales bacterium]|jgi:hypothetical protein